ncbi:hypothetical protein K503DRAFT_857965 [Rhizopogon vinicolor AM-OR11-026]|uniref:DUF6534 domain-containing protein n=1 Tax=Rhizopogon vinicolor AM-OR11-026 TaxID=1314800 RepID=A0A1B7MV53_9AGAM|nr:hypothetical protein K503DRAFT_857965 [Rhizopogon vinicolor AM-OR11-026]
MGFSIKTSNLTQPACVLGKMVQLVLAWNRPDQPIDKAYVVKGLTNTSVQNLYDISTYATAGNALTSGIDIVITTIMCTLLTRARRGFNKRTDAILVRLVILSVNSGLWTAVFAIVTAGVAVQNNLIFSWPQFCMCPLYCNTILGCLNARDFIYNGIHRDSGSAFLLGHVSISHAGGAQRPFQWSIVVDTKQTIETESLEDTASVVWSESLPPVGE